MSPNSALRCLAEQGFVYVPPPVTTVARSERRRLMSNDLTVVIMGLEQAAILASHE